MVPLAGEILERLDHFSGIKISAVRATQLDRRRQQALLPEPPSMVPREQPSLIEITLAVKFLHGKSLRTVEGDAACVALLRDLHEGYNCALIAQEFRHNAKTCGGIGWQFCHRCESVSERNTYRGDFRNTIFPFSTRLRQSLATP